MDAFEPKQAVWISPKKKGSSQNKVLLDPMGFRMHYKKKDDLKKYFQCSRKDDLQCPIRVSLDIASDKIVSLKGGSHNHDNDALEHEVKKIVKKEILNAVENSSVGGRTVMKNISASVLNTTSAMAGVAYIPSPRVISATLSRKRKRVKNFPPIPKNSSEMKTIPEAFKKTADGEDYCVMEEQVPGSDSLILGFASKAGMGVMKHSKD